MLTSDAPRRAVLLARTVPWGQVLAVLVLATAPTLTTALRGTHRFDGAVLAWMLLAGAVLAFAWDEPARATIEPSPTTLARRVTARLFLTAGAVTASWILVVLLTGMDGDLWRHLRPRVPASVAAVALSVAAAAAVRRRGAARVDLGVVFAGPLTVLVTSALAERYGWLPSFVDGVHDRRWWWIVVAAMLVAVWSTRDPYRA